MTLTMNMTCDGRHLKEKFGVLGHFFGFGVGAEYENIYWGIFSRFSKLGKIDKFSKRV